MTAPAAETEPAVPDAGSFRDPSGFVYRRDGQLLRQIQPRFAEDWAAIERSGLLGRLADEGRAVRYEEVDLDRAATPGAHRVIRPEVVPFVSYPYEWSFGQLRDAALLTLDIQLAALEAGLTLRDASAYNVQFVGARPVHIDTLSFGTASPGAPWVAYRQFCEHFLAPLALMALRDVRLGRLLRANLEGVPLDLASGLLPGRTRVRLGLGAHLHLHARAQRRFAGREAEAKARIATSRKVNVPALVTSLRDTIAGLRWEPTGTEWADYDEHTSYDAEATRAKEAAVGEALARAGGATGSSTVWDLGANVGRFSRIAADAGHRVVAFDIDPAAVERHYRRLRDDGREDILPLVMDLSDPSPGTGWAGRERASLAERGPADVALALALVHHLAIGRNVPLPAISAYLATLARHLVIEWVPREDSMVQRLLATREDVFADYTIEGFRAAFGRDWEVTAEQPIAGTARALFELRRR